MERIGLIAGNGKFPIIFARAAKAQGAKIIAVAVREETSPDLEKYVDSIHWIGAGELKKLFDILKKENIARAVMAGQIRPAHLFSSNVSLDKELTNLLSEVKDKKADSLLGAVAEKLKSQGITLIDSTTFISHLLPKPGVLTKTQPTKEQRQDIGFGKDLAKKIAGLDIGQTVVVKNKAILAIEAIEGTDEAIKRGGRLGNGNVVVVKVSKPKQDMRFDIPVIGPKTIDALIEAKASVLAIEAGKTLIIDRAGTLQRANSHKIAILVI